MTRDTVGFDKQPESNKSDAVNSGSESWTGIGVVAGVGAVVLIRQWPYRRNDDGTWGSKLLQRLQEVRTNCKTSK